MGYNLFSLFQIFVFLFLFFRVKYVNDDLGKGGVGLSL